MRREKEKKRFITLINKYDKTLTWVEKESKEFISKYIKPYQILFYAIDNLIDKDKIED